MARTPAQRGKIGNWLVERRMARGWATQEQARAEVERLTGWRIPQSVYAEWESGRRVPSEANLARLEEFYGGEPAELAGDGMAALLSRLVAAQEDQARAIREQTQAIAQAMLTISDMLGSVVPLAAELPGRTRDASARPEAESRG